MLEDFLHIVVAVCWVCWIGEEVLAEDALAAGLTLVFALDAFYAGFMGVARLMEVCIRVDKAFWPRYLAVFVVEGDDGSVFLGGGVVDICHELRLIYIICDGEHSALV